MYYIGDLTHDEHVLTIFTHPLTDSLRSTEVTTTKDEPFMSRHQLLNSISLLKLWGRS